MKENYIKIVVKKQMSPLICLPLKPNVLGLFEMLTMWLIRIPEQGINRQAKFIKLITNLL